MSHLDPISYTQESIWLLDRLAAEQDVAAYNEPLAFRIIGPVDVAALDRAVRDVVTRHPALHTTVVETADGLRSGPRPVPDELLRVVDLRDLDPGPAGERGAAVIDEEYRRPFDVATDLPVRAVLVRLPGDESLLGLTIHHLATDDWSNTLIVADLTAAYAARRAGSELPDRPAGPTPADLVRAERDRYEAGGFADAVAAWQRSLERGPDLLRMPLDRPRPAARTFAGASATLRVPRAEIDPLLELARSECRATEFTVLLAAYALLLQRYTGQDELAVGTTVLNRDDVDALEVVGCFVNTAALMIDLGDDPTVRDLLGRTSALAQQVLAQGDAPFPKVLEALDIRRDPSHTPVFQTMLTLLTRRPVLDLGPGTSTRRHPVRRAAAKFELLCYVSEDADGFEFELEYATDLYATGTIDRLLRHLVTLLRTLPEYLDAPVSTVSFLPDDERRLILDVWNDTAVAYPDRTVVDQFETQARRTPGAVAVEFEDRTLTYDQLNRVANQVARALVARRPADASPFVGVYLDRSLEMVLALVAVVKAGYAYVPIDPEYPPDRMAFMVEDSGVTTVVTQPWHRDDLERAGATDVMVLSLDDPRDEDDTNVIRSLAPDDPSYMIYTSGSTGRPKGAVNRHVSLFNRLYWMQETFQLTPEDRVLQKTPFSFDVSVWEFFWPLMVGARIVVARPGGHRDADYLKRLIARRGVTTVHFIPSILSVFLDEDDLAAFAAPLRRVICSGEALPFNSVKRFMATLPDCALHNLYGPTEAAIDVSHWPCTTDYPGAVVPIGRPIANTQLVVVDRHLALQPVGVPGELCIGGVQLATGYHQRDDLTARAFVANPHGPGRLYRTGDLARFLPDGQIQYLGRIDNQIKLRGVRIEPEEVSAALLDLPGIKDAAVVLHEAGASRMLVGYVVAEDGPVDQQEIRATLGTRLPEFMLPQIVMAVPALPTTPNGKLDRRALPDPLVASPAEEAVTSPTSPDEELFARVWGEVLGTDRLGVTTNFFRHGGDSILSITIAAQLRAHGYPVQVQDLFAHPTIRTLLAAIADRTAAEPVEVVAPFGLLDPADRGQLPSTVEDAWPLTRLQSGMIYHTMLAEDSSVYHDVFDYELEAPARPELLHRAVDLVARARPVLRSTVDLEHHGVALQLVWSDHTVPVGLTDLSDRPPAEQDRAIAEWVEQERRHRFDLAAGPLVRAWIHQRSPHRLNLALSFHHAMLDGWSVALVVEDIRRTYAELLAGGDPALAAEPVSYGTFVALEQRAAADPEAAAYWRNRLADAADTDLLSPPEATAGAAGTATAARVIPAAHVSEVEAFAAELGLPVKSLYLAAHQAVLAELTGQATVVTGLVSHGRPEIGGGAGLAGLYLNTLPVAVELRSESWAALAGRLFSLEQHGAPYRRYPLADMLRDDGRPRFNTLFNYIDFHVYAGGAAADVRITAARYFEQTSFDAVVHLHRDRFRGELTVTVNHESARVSAGLAAEYLDRYLAAVADLATRSGGPVVPGGDHPPVAHQPRERDHDRGPGETGPAAPTDLERQVAAVITAATNGTALGPDDDYLDRGVDSITVIRVVARLRRIDPALTLPDVFADRTVRRLARRLAGATGTADAGPPATRPFELTGLDPATFPAGVVDAYPATPLQLAMIRATDDDPAQARYHDVFTYRLARPLDPDVLRAAVDRITEAYETLRSSFALTGWPLPLRLVHASARLDLDVVDLTAAYPDPAARTAAFDAWSTAVRGDRFDWGAGAPLRLTAHRWSDDEFTLTLSFHHSMIDGWSLSLVIRDLVHRYVDGLAGRRLVAPPVPALAYRDHVAAELAARSSATTRAFWVNHLAGAEPTVLADRTGAPRTGRWSESAVTLQPDQQAAVAAVAARAGVPVKHVFLAVHLRVLALLTGARDVTTGVFTHGRPEVDGGDVAVGLFLNFVPLRFTVDDEPWDQLARRVFDLDQAALPHRRFPLPDLEQATGRADLFPAIVNYTQFRAYGEVAATGGDGEHRVVTEIRWFEHTPFPLLVNIGHETDLRRTRITLNADGARLSQPWVESAADLYNAVLHQLTAGASSAGITPPVAAALRRLGLEPSTSDRSPSMTGTLTTDQHIVHTFEQSDGYRSNYRQWGPDQGRDVVLMLHGGMSHSGWQGPLGTAMSATDGVTFIAVDRRGSGLNADRGHIPSSEQVLTDTVELLRELRRRYHRVHLAGWCFGAEVATAVAGRHGDENLFASLVMVSPGFYYNERYADVLRLSIESAQTVAAEFDLRPAPTRAYIKVPLQPSDFTARPEWREFVERDELKLTLVTDGTVAAWAELGLMAERAVADLGETPVLAVFGRQDRLVDNARVRNLLSQAKRLTVAELDTGHAVHFEAVEPLAGIITSFLAQS